MRAVACLIKGVPGGPEQPPGAFCWAPCSPRAGDPARTGLPGGGKGAPCGVGPPGVAGSSGVAGTAGGSGVAIAAGSADSARVSLFRAQWPSPMYNAVKYAFYKYVMPKRRHGLTAGKKMSFKKPIRVTSTDSERMKKVIAPGLTSLQK